MKFLVATTSKIKLRAVEEVIGEILKDRDLVVIGCDVSSDVSETPWGEETLVGARNRAKNSKEKGTSDYNIGLESGLVDRYGEVFEEAWACVLSADGKECLGFSSGLKIPNIVLKEMQETSEEHNQVMKRLRKNPEGPKDTWGDYTGQYVLRSVSLKESLRNALIQIFAPDNSYYHL